ncbi:branched-chain amino acid aminotransferase [Leucobacter sp. GX24907]
MTVSSWTDDSAFTVVAHPDPASTALREELLRDPRFGQTFTDHMVTIEYTDEAGWHSPTVGPLREFSLHPASAVLHYAQEVFEGLKAHARDDGSVALFRVEQHAERFNSSLRRLAMPEMPTELFVAAVKRLVRADAGWVPSGPGQSLYIRPFAFATDTVLGAGKASSTYTFAVIASPTAGWFGGEQKAISVWVEEHYVRAARGGIGDVKAGANYAGALLGLRASSDHGCDQVVWLDAAEQKWIEEAGAMNLFLVADRGDGITLLTPALTGTFLPGITRRSIIELAPKLGLRVEETRISLDDWREMARSGELLEAFACGTAAVLVSIGSVHTQDEAWTVGDGSLGGVAQEIRERLLGIQRGTAEDIFGWTTEVV